MTPVSDQDAHSRNNSIGDNLSELPDETLVRLCKERGSRDDRPFTTLYRRHQMLVWRLCHQFARNSRDAEDLVQEVFFKAYRGLANFEGRSSFRTWLYRIAINTCQNELRRRSRRPMIHPEAFESVIESIPSTDATELPWTRQSWQDALARALTLIPSEEFEVIQMKDINQRSYAEIAQFLGIGMSATKMRVHRARLALRVAYLREIESETS